MICAANQIVAVSVLFLMVKDARVFARQGATFGAHIWGLALVSGHCAGSVCTNNRSGTSTRTHTYTNARCSIALYISIKFINTHTSMLCIDR